MGSMLVVPVVVEAQPQQVQPSPARPSPRRLKYKNNGLSICMSWCAGLAAMLRAGDIVRHTKREQEPRLYALSMSSFSHTPTLGSCTVTQCRFAAVASS